MYKALTEGKRKLIYHIRLLIEIKRIPIGLRFQHVLSIRGFCHNRIIDE